MTSIIKFSLKELNILINDENSCVVKKTVTRKLAFQPWCLSNLKDSVEKIMDDKIGKFDKELNGIIVSYKNAKILDDLCAIRHDSSEIYSDVQADLFIFQPHVGATLHGIVNKQCITHLGVLVHKVFNVVIPRPSEELGNKWIGSQLSVGQKVVFKIVVLDLFGALPYIRGCLDENSLPLDDLGCDEMKGLVASHVNFDGTKPMTSKLLPKSSPENHVHSKKHNGKLNKSGKMDNSPSKCFSGSSSSSSNSFKNKHITTQPGDKGSQSNTPAKKPFTKKCLDSDSDSISDVDEEEMQTQSSIIKKIMNLDKSQRAAGIKPSFAPNSMGIIKINKSKPTINKHLVDIKKLKQISSFYSKDSVDKSADKSDISVHRKISDCFEDASMIIKPTEDIYVLDTTNTQHKKKSKRTNKQNLQNDDNLETNNLHKKSTVSTSTPFPNADGNLKNKFSNGKNREDDKASKKKLSFSNASSENTMEPSSFSVTEIISADSKKTKKYKHETSNFESSSANDTDVSELSFKKKMKSKKLLANNLESTSPIKKTKSKKSHSSLGINIGIETKEVELCANDGIPDLTNKTKKRKRKTSESSLNQIISDDLQHSDASNKSPPSKKRKSGKVAIETEDDFIRPADVDLSDERLQNSKKKRKSYTNEDHSDATLSESVEDTRNSKHKCKKSSKVREIFSLIEEDPSLLEEIQLLIKARSSKKKNSLN